MITASNRRDLTSGSIWSSLLLFALPLLAGSLVQQLCNTVDLLFVGNFIDKSASAAVGASSLLITCLIGVFGGISVGSGIVIAQIFGDKNTERLSRAIHNTAAMSIVSGLLNVAMDYLLIRMLDNGVNGVAWATLMSQTASAIMVLICLARLDSAYALRPAKIAFDRELFRRTVSVDMPTGIQSLVITLSNVMVQCAAMSMLLAATARACIPFGEQLFRIFAREESVIQLGRQIIGMTYPFYFIYPIFQVFGDSMRGVGKSKVPMLIVLLNICLIRTALLFVIVPQAPSVTGVAAVYPIAWALTAIGMVGYYMHFHRRRDMAEKGHLRAELAADENI